MATARDKIESPSPFHRGEQALQTQMGVRDKMEHFGRRVIRSFMPQQHQDFYARLPFIFAGHVDQQGWPWASILHAPNGDDKTSFINALDDTHLQFDCQPVAGDPLGEALAADSAAGLNLGLLGIELPSRRRNRLAGHLVERDNGGFTLQVDQCFGNCPQYIQSRDVEILDAANMPAASVENLSELDEPAMELILRSDTFFVASYYANDDRVDEDLDNTPAANEGVDVSHRGGKPGFVRIDNSRHLIIPDYLGNNHFNTLGNILENGKAGLLFIDFSSGEILTMSGRAQLLPDAQETRHFKGAERLWTFELQHARRLRHALPLRWSFNDYSANTQLTGSWPEAEQAATAERLRDQWQGAEVIKTVEESSTIKSFYLRPTEGGIASFSAGQFLSLKLPQEGGNQVRTYTVSSAPADDYYRISVKRENRVSGHLHDHVNVGDRLQIKSPGGSFHWKNNSKKPMVLLSAGVGITPMVSMARHGLYEAVRTRSARQITVISAARNNQQRAFHEELELLTQQSAGSIRAYWALSQPEEELQDGSYHQRGRIDKNLLQAVLPMDDYEFYLCGPAAFMQSMYDLLRELGVADRRIMAEEFGPASLQRERQQLIDLEPIDEPSAEQALVSFVDPDGGALVEQQWSPLDGSLLDLAEAHGFSPEYGCRSGQCGACKTRLIAGEVVQPGADLNLISDDEVLLCCASPAADEKNGLPQVTIELAAS